MDETYQPGIDALLKLVERIRKEEWADEKGKKFVLTGIELSLVVLLKKQAQLDLEGRMNR